MKIRDIRLSILSVPLRVPFKTALRSVSSVQDVVVKILTDTDETGFGEAPPTGVITGDTTGAIVGAIRDHIAPKLIGRDIEEFETLLTESIWDFLFSAFWGPPGVRLRPTSQSA